MGPVTYDVCALRQEQPNHTVQAGWLQDEPDGEGQDWCILQGGFRCPACSLMDNARARAPRAWMHCLTLKINTSCRPLAKRVLTMSIHACMMQHLKRTALCSHQRGTRGGANAVGAQLWSCAYGMRHDVQVWTASCSRAARTS